MRRQVEAYGYWSDHPADRAEWTCGSGYLLGGRLVLTAAHVVCPGGRPVARVQVRDESGLVAARVAWHRWDDEVDIALLEMTEPGWVAPVWRHPVRWGQLVTTRAGQACEAIGFPKVVASPQRRDSHHATGVINPGSLVKAGLSAMEVDNPPVGPGPGGSWWAGMSGAALLCQQRVIGVVTTDPEGFDSRRLVTVPVATVIKDPEFRDLITRHVGRAPVLEPVELTGLAEPVQAADSPAGLLRAGVADTPFRDRPELDVLRRWCRSSPWSSIRLVAGPGGQGKTRLARQLANELGGQGWATVMLAERVPEVQIAVLAQVRVPTLIVVDYAEGRTHQLEAVLAAMGQAEAKVRLLLLARTAGAWRTERVDPSPLLEPLADERIVVQLGPLEPTPQGRQAAWRQAVTALAAGLSELDLTRDGDSIDWATHAAGLATPVLDGPGYRTILAVQIDALARLLQAGAPLTDPGNPPEQILLAHESRYWTRVATRFGVTLTPPTRQCLVATATLWGAANAEQAHDLLSAALPERRTEERSTIGEWLSALYRDGQRYWSGVQPDRLAEHLIGTTLTDPQRCPGVLTSAVNCARDEQLDHALTVLGRAVPQHPGLAEVIAETIQTAGGPGGLAALTVAPRLEHPQPMLEALQPLINSASIDTLQTLSSALPRHSMLLGPISLALTTTLVARLRDATIANRDAHLPALAGSVNNLAVDLAEVGRRGEALTAAQEAADLYRELVALNRDAHVPDLAMSVNNLAVDLAEVGRRGEALTAAQEAADLYRELVALNRDAYLPALAASVNNLANHLAEVGRRAEALTAAEEAADLYRELVALNRDAYLPALAASVNNLANHLAEVGRRAEALTAAEEAADLYRELVALNRDAYLPALAMSVNNLAIRLGEVGRRGEALTAAHEAVTMRRELVALNRNAYLPALAASVNNLAVRLGEVGRRGEALTAAHEAADLYRELVALNRDAYLPALAASVNNLAVDLAEVGRRGEALTAAHEAVTMRRELVALNRDAYLPDLAMSVNNLANHRAEVGRRGEALTAAHEAVTMRRELVALNRDAYLPALAASVNNLAVRLGEVGRRGEALTAAQEAADLYQELAQIYPDVFNPEGERARSLVAELSIDPP